MAKCAYRGEGIREIKEERIDENVEGEEERRRKKERLSERALKLLFKLYIILHA